MNTYQRSRLLQALLGLYTVIVAFVLVQASYQLFHTPPTPASSPVPVLNIDALSAVKGVLDGRTGAASASATIVTPLGKSEPFAK